MPTRYGASHHGSCVSEWRQGGLLDWPDDGVAVEETFLLEVALEGVHDSGGPHAFAAMRELRTGLAAEAQERAGQAARLEEAWSAPSLR